MRPVELSLEGFRSYRDPVVFSFDQRGLFGIVGPTGSGKSSILDALIYALYGETPRIKRSTKSLINTRDDQARVHLVFDVSGKLWEVTRVLRLTGASKVVLHPRDDRSAPIEGESNVNAHIETMVGLDANAFCSSVTLPQGEFDRFLRATPAIRSQILKGIFQLERVDAMKAEAMQRLGIVEGRLETLTKASESLPDDPVAAMNNLKAGAKQADMLMADIKAALPSVRKAEQELDSTLVAIAGLEERIAEVQDSTSNLPPTLELERLVEEQAAASRASAGAQAQATAADEAEARARERSEQLEMELGGQKWLTEVDRGVQELQRLTDDVGVLVARIAETRKSAGTLAADAKRQETNNDEAESQLHMAREELHKTHAENSAGVLRASLSKDHPCPVCEQIVKSVPKLKPSPQLKTAENAVSECEKTVVSMRAALQETVKRKEINDDQSRRAEADMGEKKRLTQAVAKLLAGLVGKGDPMTELKRRTALIESARLALTASANLRQTASALAAATRKTQGAVDAQVGKVASTLNRACGLLRIGPPTDDLLGTRKIVDDAASAAEADLGQQVAELRSNRQRAFDTIEGFRTRFLATAGTSDEVLARAVAAHSEVLRDIKDLEKAIAKAKEAEAQATLLRKSRGHYERIKADFSDAKFMTYLLEKHRKVLSALASEKLRELTGHYRFDPDGEFQIIDVRTGDARHPETLSGGETFLASLALALALGEAVSLGGARLDCFFLDEGFGSLDRESLDLALQGIENLAQPGRLIGLISHVPGIQQSLSDLIVLDKTAEGTTVVVQHEGPIGYEPVLI